MSESSPERVEHLKMVQAVIARMADSSAQMKTWALSLVTAVILFSGLSDDPHWLIGLGGCILVVMFWIMDARYLHLNRCYRKLFESVAAGEPTKSFELDYRSYVASDGSLRTTALSWSVLLFYTALLAVMFVLSIIVATMGECSETQSLL